MISSNQVKVFHLKFGQPISNFPRFPSSELVKFRNELLVEELNELDSAIFNENLEQVADSIADIIYVLIGTSLVYGIPIEKVFDEVHRANMDKEPTTNPDISKPTKPNGWKPPDINSILNEVILQHYRMSHE